MMMIPKQSIISVIAIPIALIIGLLSLAYGQTGQEPLTESDIQALIKSATKYESPYLVIIDGSGTFSPYVGIILDHYIKNGFEIKTIQGTTIFMQIK